MPCFAVAAVYGGEQNGLNQIYYFRTLSSEIITPVMQGILKGGEAPRGPRFARLRLLAPARGRCTLE